MPQFQFRDRKDAGQRLAEVLRARDLGEPLVCALPRGGVPVAAEIASALGCPLDLVLVRKLGVPQQPELAFGAVVDGQNPETVLNKDIVQGAGLSQADINMVRERELAEIERRRRLYFKDQPPHNPQGRNVIVVDDGLATGATARVALHALRRAGVKRLILAVPLAPTETLEAMRGEADEIVCLSTPRPFRGVEASYAAFPQLTDTDVLDILESFEIRSADSPGPQ